MNLRKMGRRYVGEVETRKAAKKTCEELLTMTMDDFDAAVLKQFEKETGSPLTQAIVDTLARFLREIDW